MSKEKKLQPMPNAAFKGMIWFYRLCDFFWNPKRHLKKIPLKEGMTVVDYGCGPGRYSLPVAESVGLRGKVFAVDIQPLAVKTVKEKAVSQGLTNIETILVDSYNSGIQDSSIDLVLLIDTLHFINDCNALFREIHRILKQDGLIFMDKGHLKMSRATELVESTDLFTIQECRGHDMLVSPKTSSETSEFA